MLHSFSSITPRIRSINPSTGSGRTERMIGSTYEKIFRIELALNKITEDYITGALNTDNLLINLEKNLSPGNTIEIPLIKHNTITWVPAELSRVLQNIRETKYIKDNIYMDMKNKMQKMLEATRKLVGKRNYQPL